MKIFCKECKEECQLVTIDNGIGHYEYWGAKGYDSQPFTGSNCCECEVMDEDGDDLVVEDLMDEKEYNYDRR